MDSGVAFRAMLDEARAALNVGDAVDGERRAKAVSALVRAERDVAEFLSQAHAASGDDEEACRAELRRRLALFEDAGGAGAPADVLARIAREGVA